MMKPTNDELRAMFKQWQAGVPLLDKRAAIEKYGMTCHAALQAWITENSETLKNELRALIDATLEASKKQSATGIKIIMPRFPWYMRKPVLEEYALVWSIARTNGRITTEYVYCFTRKTGSRSRKLTEKQRTMYHWRAPRSIKLAEQSNGKCIDCKRKPRARKRMRCADCLACFRHVQCISRVAD